MCLAIPGFIVEISKNGAVVDFGGINRTVALDLLPDAKVGEYILAHAGFALQKLDTKEAHELIELFQELELRARELSHEY